MHARIVEECSSKKKVGYTTEGVSLASVFLCALLSSSETIPPAFLSLSYTRSGRARVEMSERPFCCFVLKKAASRRGSRCLFSM